MEAFGRLIRWQIQSRFSEEVVVPWIEGSRLAVHRGMTGATGNIYAGLHEFADMAFLLHFLRRGDIFADVGANIGSYSILASAVRGATSIAFEPDPGTFASLKRNVMLNGIEELTMLHETALGATAGQVEFTTGLDTTNHVADNASDQTRTVSMVTLDQVLENRRPIMMKMDVEGFEFDVLQGALRTLASSELQAVLTENRSPAVVAVLGDVGFQERRYDPFTRRLLLPDGTAAANALFLRNIAFAQERVSSAALVQVLGRRL